MISETEGERLWLVVGNYHFHLAAGVTEFTMVYLLSVQCSGEVESSEVQWMCSLRFADGYRVRCPVAPHLFGVMTAVTSVGNALEQICHMVQYIAPRLNNSLQCAEEEG